MQQLQILLLISVTEIESSLWSIFDFILNLWHLYDNNTIEYISCLFPDGSEEVGVLFRNNGAERVWKVMKSGEKVTKVGNNGLSNYNVVDKQGAVFQIYVYGTVSPALAQS